MTALMAQKINNTRPKILLKAARICAKGYTRETMLPRLIGNSTQSVIALLEAKEETLEEDRKAQVCTYSAQAHVEVLSALIAEAKKAA